MLDILQEANSHNNSNLVPGVFYFNAGKTQQILVMTNTAIFENVTLLCRLVLIALQASAKKCEDQQTH